MAYPDRYAMLLSSLPYHGPLFGAKQTPLSRIRLNQRLALLDPLEAEWLRDARRLLEWAQQEPEHTDAEAIMRAKRLIDGIASPFIRDLVTWRLELRTLVAALRRRHRGEPAPRDPRWGFGRWLIRISGHWNEPDFGLAGAFPWLPEAKRLLDRGASVELERLLLGAVWSHLERVSDGHYLDFEAIVIYVLRWDMIARWTKYDGEEAAQRFDGLVEKALSAVEGLHLPAVGPQPERA
ncbi:MAG: DUF2764 domain-containing protein [Thiocapsa sp.]|jgi:hypothetical protein|nr:DUF2764 family protein [Thiocapsa sp.]MCG6897344.1 DUF2764 domain-containing protein [Thiocapsa sp.]MCG6986423.1 DUF2764 domain-containing protein [Thiocapsa sp.]